MIRHRDYLDTIFRGATDLMNELTAESDSFTNQEFLKEIVRRSPGAYIDFLAAVKAERGEQDAFNIVHQAIGLELSKVAQEAGYKQEKTGRRDEKTIFNTDTERVIYRRLP